MQGITASLSFVDADGRIAPIGATWEEAEGRDTQGSLSHVGLVDYLQALGEGTALDKETVRAIQAGIEEVRANRLGRFELAYRSSGAPRQQYLIRVYPIPSRSRLMLVHEEMSAENTPPPEQGDSSRLAAIATLSGGLAHELNNCLTAMLGFGELALSSIPSATPTHGYVQQVVAAARRGRDLVTELLAFSRHRDAVRQLVSPHVLLKEMVRVLKSGLPENIELRTAIPTSTRRVEADPHELHCVFVLILASAEQALTAQGGVLDVRLDEIQPDQALRSALPTLIAEPYVRLIVKDERMRHDCGVEPGAVSPARAVADCPEGTDLSVLGRMIARQGGAMRILDQPEGRTVEVYLLGKQEGG